MRSKGVRRGVREKQGGRKGRAYGKVRNKRHRKIRKIGEGIFLDLQLPSMKSAFLLLHM